MSVKEIEVELVRRRLAARDMAGGLGSPKPAVDYDMHTLVAALDEACAKCEQLDQQACDAEARAERAEQKLARIRQLVTYERPLQGEQPGVPRFVVKGCEVLAVLDGEDV
jgi:hypothetical protein